MATSKTNQLLQTLEQLEEKEFKKFKWFLINDVPDGFDPIPKNKLENADEMDTVETMVETYTFKQAMKITVEILRNMNQNNLAERLMSKCLWVLSVFFLKLETKTTML